MLQTMPRKAPLTGVFLRLKLLREEFQLTQRELAAATGIAEGTIKAWESGRVQDLTLDAIRRLAPAFGMDVPQFIRYVDTSVTARDRTSDDDARRVRLKRELKELKERVARIEQLAGDEPTPPDETPPEE